MNTKLNNIQIQPGYEDLFSFDNKESEIQHKAEMISYKILSEIEKLCEERKIKKKDLADMVGTSKSYITQLFTGAKQVNTHIMAKLENALNVTFNFKVMQVGESQIDNITKHLTKQDLHNPRLQNPGIQFCYIHRDDRLDNKTSQLVAQMSKEENKNSYKQVA